jgi:hypothetical protein
LEDEGVGMTTPTPPKPIEANKTEIPEDVLQAVYAAMSWVDESGAKGVIARAILAERERCAIVAENRYTEQSVLKSKAGKPYTTGSMAIFTGQQIAAAIRLPSTTSKEGE